MSERWVPISFKFDSTSASVKWLNFGERILSESFFNHAIRPIKAESPANQRTTSLSELLEAAEAVPSVDPAGIIFHVSRCGSTMLTNVLKTGDQVSALAEALPIGILFQNRIFESSPFPTEKREDVRRMLLNAVVRLCAASFGSNLVIKCHAASILQIARIRAVWPNVPFLILIRDPVEIAMSNLAAPAGWLRAMHRPADHWNLFGLSNLEIQQISIQEYCARGLGEFCTAALKQMDDLCWVTDYDDLDISTIYSVAKLFNIQLPNADTSAFQEAFSSYSKPRLKGTPYQDDRPKKQESAPAAVRRLVAQWAHEPYDRLRRGGNFPLNVLGRGGLAFRSN